MKKLSLIILALILGLAMSTSLMAGTYSGGDGTSAGTAYQIADLDDLQELQNTSGDWGSYFKQTADIDASATSSWDGGAGFSPIGDHDDEMGTRFTGSYDGQNHTIDELFINRPGESVGRGIGLFGGIGDYSNGATITNIGLTNVDIAGFYSVGGLVGKTNNSNSEVSNSYVTGAVSGVTDVGGLIGEHRDCPINNCYTTCSVSGNIEVGGLVGYNVGGATISNCYSTSDVTRKSGSANVKIGGFIGYNHTSTIEYCYSTGNVIYTDASNPTDKGFVGDNYSGTYNDNFWDSDASNQSTATGADPKTTAQMTTDALVYSYTTNIYLAGGWDFKGESTNGTEDIWNIGNSRNDGYPYLDWQYSEDDASLPVELSSFTAENQSGGVLLKWCTESEIENLGFILERRYSKLEIGNWEEIAGYLSNSALEGHGSTTEAHEYQYTDNAVQPGVTYEYRLGDVDYSGKVTWHGKVEIKVKAEDVQIPTEFGLQRAYPNPFNPTTTISYQLASASFVKISIYDVTGKFVETLVNEQKDRGSYSVILDAGGLSSGIYIYKITAGKYSSINKCLLIR